MKLSEREKLILKKLFQTNKPMTISELSQLVNKSARTVKNDVSDLKLRLQAKNIKLKTKPRIGVWLEMETAMDFDLDALISPDTTFTPTQSKERVYFIINHLIENNHKFTTLEKIANTIFVSKSTVAKDLEQVKKHLLLHRLSLTKKVYRGIKVDLEEHEIRAIQSTSLKSILMTEISSIDIELFRFFPELNIKKIREILKAVESRFDFILTDFSFQDMVIHILILINRKLSGNGIQDNLELNKLETNFEFTIATDIATQISIVFDLLLDNNEISYLTNLLFASRRQNDHAEFAKLESLNPFLHQNLKLIFENLSLEKGVNIDSDKQLFTDLFIHLNLALKRLKSGIVNENPLVDQISEKYKVAFDLACSVAKQLQVQYGCEISKHEIGYIALYLRVHIEKHREEVNKKILIICNNGVGNLQLLASEITNLFSNIRIVAVATPREAMELLITDYKPDVILSTTPFVYKDFSVHQISYILTDEDIQNIEEMLESDQN